MFHVAFSELLVAGSETTKKRFFEKCDWQGKHQRCSLIEIILTSHLEAGLHIWHVWNFNFDFWILYGILRLLELRLKNLKKLLPASALYMRRGDIQDGSSYLHPVNLLDRQTSGERSSMWCQNPLLVSIEIQRFEKVGVDFTWGNVAVGIQTLCLTTSFSFGSLAGVGGFQAILLS